MGSFGRLDQNVEVAAGNDKGYIRLNTNRSVSDSYKDGNGTIVPSDWERWNADVALGWTPDENTWIELTGGKADGEAVYAGRGMDGSQFARESLGLRVEKRNISDVIQKVEGQINYNYNDHVMDNYSLRQVEEPNKAMTVTRRTLNSRLSMTQEWDKLALISGIDSQFNKHAGGMYHSTKPMMNSPVTIDMEFQSVGGFGELSYDLGNDNKVVSGLRIDQVKIDSLKRTLERKETLPSAFIRFENTHPEHDDSKTYIGLGYVERVPDYWELFKTDLNGEALSTFKDLKQKNFTVGSGLSASSWRIEFMGICLYRLN